MNRSNLYNDGTRKECGRCHEIKLYNEFYSKKDGLRSICKNCNKLIVAEESFKNKLLILTNIYEGKFNGKCSNCDSDFINLPSIDFHHQNKKLKQIRWRDNRFKNWTKLMLAFEQESVVPLCKNCHSLENARLFMILKILFLERVYLKILQKKYIELFMIMLKRVKRSILKILNFEL